MLARELLSKPDGFLMATCEDKEFLINGVQRKFTIANTDDRTMYWTLKLCEYKK